MVGKKSCWNLGQRKAWKIGESLEISEEKKMEEIEMQLVLGSGRKKQDIGLFTVPSKGHLSY